MMVDTALPSGVEATPARYRVERLTDKESIRSLLATEGAYVAYGIAQLAPALFARSEWWSGKAASGSGLVLHSQGGLGPALLTIGDAAAVDAILSLHPGARSSFATFRTEHLPAMQRRFLLMRKELMVRMAVTGEMFQPRAGEAYRLRSEDIAAVNRLYSTEGGPATYSSRHLEEGVYYGVKVNDRLVSIAGTHVASPSERVAVVGNVFTHPRYRGRGLATVATSAVTEALLEQCDLVALTVEQRNVPALAVYDRLGYRQECTLYETPAIRKDALGLVSGVRRLAAVWRDRHEGKEVVLR